MVAAVAAVVLINAQYIYYWPSHTQSVMNKLKEVIPVPQIVVEVKLIPRTRILYLSKCRPLPPVFSWI